MRKLSRVLACVLLASLFAVLIPAAAQDTEAQTPEEICAASVPAAEPTSRTFSQANQILEAGVDYRAVFCTGAGPVYIDLLEKDTPITVNNFVFLAEQGYYNNTTFHRVIEAFMAQGGDPTATGTGGPGYSFADEFVPSLRFDAPGKLAMANAGPNTNGSQFFITTSPTPHLNGLHTIFGEVLYGQSNVQKIELRDPSSATTPGTSLDAVVIITDPATVTLPERAAPDQATVVEAFNQVAGIITSDIADILEDVQTEQTTQEVVDAAPAEAQEALQTLLEANNHQYKVSNSINNKACDLETVQFISIGYSLDAFASREDAAAVLADPAMAELPLTLGYTESPTATSLAYPVYTTNVTACDQPAVHAMTFYQRGSFIATVEVTLPASAPAVGQLDRVLSEYVAQQIYESFLASVLFWDIQ